MTMETASLFGRLPVELYSYVWSFLVSVFNGSNDKDTAKKPADRDNIASLM